MNTFRAATLSIIAILALALAACDDDSPSTSNDDTPTSPSTASPAAPADGPRATLLGTLTLDGRPLDADFLGARVVRDGLAAACQGTLPGVVAGEYEIEVVSDSEVRGCGAPGAQIILWAFADDTYYFTNETLPWPEAGPVSLFDATFSSAAPAGAADPVTEFKGRVLDKSGGELPEGTVIEAYAGDVLCGITSLRPFDETEGIYTLIVAGPDAIAACPEGATLTFRLDGAAAQQTAVNDLNQSTEGHELDLTLQ